MNALELSSHDIRRTEETPGIGLLLGNGEMGGLLRNDGHGFDELWLTDFWRNEAERHPIAPLYLEIPGTPGHSRTSNQTLSLGTGVATTANTTYTTEFFFSQSNRHLLCGRVKNTSAVPLSLVLHLPGQVVAEGPRTFTIRCEASSPPMALPFTAATLAIRSGLRAEGFLGNTLSFTLLPDAEFECHFVVFTSFDSAEFETVALETVAQAASYAAERRAHEAIWEELWSRIKIGLPPGLYATTFYRSIYYTLSITGASRFLPGVCQFADPGWSMIPFSNDAGYIAPLLASLNMGERAGAMLREFFRPEALKHNASVYLNILGAAGTLDESNDAYCFAQMIGISGRETNFIFGRQRHLDGFMPAMFHRTALLTNDAELRQMAYEVLRGCSEFWLRMLFRDESTGSLMIRATLDLDEKTVGVSTLSAVVACHWTLSVFAREARHRRSHSSLAERCESAVTELHWPQNAEHLLSFPGDTEEVVTNKYNCLRSFSTLGYPYCELVGDYDLPKVYRTLDSVRRRNQLDDVDHGVNAMTTNMYALTEACLGRGAEAHSYASLALRRLDSTGIAMGEARTDSLFYCSTSYCTFALSTIQMLLQATESVIRPFCALPPEWKDISFEKLPTVHGIFVSAALKNGRVEKVIYEREGNLLLETHDSTPVHVEISGKNITLKPLPQL